MYHTAVLAAGDSGAPLLNNSLVYGIAASGTASSYMGTGRFTQLFDMIVDEREASVEKWE